MNRFALACALAATFALCPLCHAEDVASHMRAAQTAANAKDFVKAGTELDAALALEPDNAQLLTARAVVCATQKEFAGAIKSLSHMLELQPKNADALRLRAEMYGQSGDAARADADFVAFLRLSDAGFAAFKAQAQAASDAPKFAGEPWAGAYRGWDLLARARPTDARSLFERGVAGIRLHPATNFGGTAEDARKEFPTAWAQADADFAAAIAADPAFGARVDIFNAGNFGGIDRADNSRKGIALLNQSLAKSPDNLELLLARADLQRQLDASTYTTDAQKGAIHQGVVDAYTAVLKVAPHNFAALSARAVAYGKYSFEHPDLALLDLNDALTQRPDDTDCLDMRADIYASKQDFVRALADYDRLCALHPNDKRTANLQFERLLALRNSPDKTRALAEANRMVALSPADDSLVAIRAEIELAQKDYAAALTDIDRATALIPKDSMFAKDHANDYAKTRAAIVAARGKG